MDALVTSAPWPGEPRLVPAGSTGLGSGQRRMLTLLQTFQNSFSWAEPVLPPSSRWHWQPPSPWV